MYILSMQASLWRVIIRRNLSSASNNSPHFVSRTTHLTGKAKLLPSRASHRIEVHQIRMLRPSFHQDMLRTHTAPYLNLEVAHICYITPSAKENFQSLILTFLTACLNVKPTAASDLVCAPAQR